MFYLKMNVRRDGFGYLYGHVLDKHQRLEPVRVDMLPPKNQWHGDIMPGHISLDMWQLYLDGVFVAGFTTYNNAMAWLHDYVNEKNRRLTNE